MPWEAKEGSAILKSPNSQGMSRDQIRSIYDAKNRYLVDRSPRFSPNLAANTSGNYEQFIRGLWNFLAYLGRYEEMIMLLPHVPQMPDDVVPSITPDTICEFVYHRFQLPNSPLKRKGDPDGVQAKDCKGKPMDCEGIVRNIEWFDSLFAAITYIHQKAFKGNQYVPPCQQCMAKAGQELCEAHQDRGKTKVHYTRSQGNPILCRQVDELKGWLSRVSTERKYKASKRSPFLPDDIKQFHRTLDRNNFDIGQLSLYTALLLSIQVAGRWDGYSNIDVDNNINDTHQHWIVQDNRILSYALRIKEKTDNDYVTYRVHFQDTVPEFCWARHILILNHCSGISSGYLFPNSQQLDDACAKLRSGSTEGFHATRSIDYSAFIKYINYNRQFCKGSEKANFGPHSPRPTKYLFDFLGGADIYLAAKTARHKSFSIAVKYLDDSQSIRDIVNEHPILREMHKVPPYRDTIISGNGENVERALMALPNRTRDVQTLSQLGTLFVKHMLGVSPESAHYRDAAYLLKRSYGMSLANVATTGEDMHVQQIKALVPEAQQYALLQSYDNVTQAAQKDAQMEKRTALEEQDRLVRVQAKAEAREQQERWQLQQTEQIERWQQRKLDTLQEQYREKMSRMYEQTVEAKANLERKQKRLQGQLEDLRNQQREVELKQGLATNEAVQKWWTETRQKLNVTCLPQVLPTLPFEAPAGTATAVRDSPSQEGPPRQGLLPGERSQAGEARPSTSPKTTGHKGREVPAAAAQVQAITEASPKTTGEKEEEMGVSQIEVIPPGSPKTTGEKEQNSGQEEWESPASNVRPVPIEHEQLVPEAEGVTPSPTTANLGNAKRKLHHNPYAKKALNMIPANQGQTTTVVPQIQIPIHSGTLLEVIAVPGRDTSAYIRATTLEKVRRSKGREKAAVVAELMLEMGELVLDASKTARECYEAGKKQLYDSLHLKAEKNKLQSWVTRVLRPLEHHFFVCSRADKITFLQAVKGNFTTLEFAKTIQCQPCLEAALAASNSAKTNAKKANKTMEMLQGSEKRRKATNEREGGSNKRRKT